MEEWGNAMADERFLVTGAFGCIGSWVVKRLVDEQVPVWAYDLPGEPHRLRLIMRDEQLAQVQIIAGDVTDADAFERVVASNGITHIIHLAALQVPFVRADPVQGARVNVVGTAIVLETAKRHHGQVRGLVYASSAGVYGADDDYPPGPLAHDAPLKPPTLYGVYKQANEGMARNYWEEHGVRSVGLRPYIVYGPGRDQGMTSTPTKAMLAAAIGRPYQISFSGTFVFQYAADAAGAFVRAVRHLPDGAPVYNLGGSTANMDEVISAIRRAAPEAGQQVTYNAKPNAGPAAIDDHALEAGLGQFDWIALDEGVRRTIDLFRDAAQQGKLNVEHILS